MRRANNDDVVGAQRKRKRWILALLAARAQPREFLRGDSRRKRYPKEASLEPSIFQARSSMLASRTQSRQHVDKAAVVRDGKLHIIQRVISHAAAAYQTIRETWQKRKRDEMIWDFAGTNIFCCSTFGPGILGKKKIDRASGHPPTPGRLSLAGVHLRNEVALRYSRSKSNLTSFHFLLTV